MRFMPVNDESQQAMQRLHRTRQGFIEEKTAIYNRLLGLISEFGVIAPQSTDALRRMVLSRRVFYRFRCSDVLMIYWNTLIALKRA
jgi:transposase